MYLCISTYNRFKVLSLWGQVVNCFKMCIFALARTTIDVPTLLIVRCELLQNVYLCISTYNLIARNCFLFLVVNCFKMCIFALARTTSLDVVFICGCCELLQNVYLCISTYNREQRKHVRFLVVNCFKMCIFALARTTYLFIDLLEMEL